MGNSAKQIKLSTPVLCRLKQNTKDVLAGTSFDISIDFPILISYESRAASFLPSDS